MQKLSISAHKGLGFLLCAAFAGGAAAAEAPADAQARYQKERAICLADKSHQDRATCLREAGAALDDAKRNRAAGTEPSDFEKNAQARCTALPEPDRTDCVARVLGRGKASGSVESGGIYRETVTRSVGTAAKP